jgi:hypothetical protein
MRLVFNHNLSDYSPFGAQLPQRNERTITLRKEGGSK